jgi:hypothetical protein
MNGFCLTYCMGSKIYFLKIGACMRAYTHTHTHTQSLHIMYCRKLMNCSSDKEFNIISTITEVT